MNQHDPEGTTSRFSCEKAWQKQAATLIQLKRLACYTTF